MDLLNPDNMNQDELILVGKCQQGDKTAFGVLYDQYIQKIYNFIYYKTHHKETAEDLTSETFIKAWKSINQFSTETKFFSAWLYQIARNTVTDHFRSAKYKYEFIPEDAWDFKSDANIESDLDTKLKLEKVKVHLQKLSAIQREIVILRVWEELSYKEIAAIIGKSEDNCKMIFSRALTALKKEIPIAAYIGLLLCRF